MPSRGKPRYDGMAKISKPVVPDLEYCRPIVEAGVRKNLTHEPSGDYKDYADHTEKSL